MTLFCVIWKKISITFFSQIVPTNLINLQGFFKPIWGLVDLTPVSSHATKSQVTCNQYISYIK